MNKYDMGAGVFTITGDRLDLVDFTLPFMQSEHIFLAKIPKVKNRIFSFFSPFSTEIWIGILVSFLSLTMVLSLMLRNLKI